MASPAHELDVCFLHGVDDDHGEYLPPLPVFEESDDDCTRQVQPDMSAAEPMDPPAFKTRCSNRAIRRGPSWFQVPQHE